jgi:[acyl-carrier-protein] S-malonyltransferase
MESIMNAVLFPGQGSQKVGMGKNHYDENDSFRKMFERADDLLGYSLTDIMFEGPHEKLTQTKFTQPAIFLHSLALYKELDVVPEMVAGHSLGEFTALAAAEVLTFEQALDLVALRGKLMQEAGIQYPGTMAAIIGMEDEVVDEICRSATEVIQKPVVAANYNSPGQLVISGDVDAVKKAVDLAQEKGCRLAKMLPVSGAFHSPLMEPATSAFRQKVEDIDFAKAKYPVYSNVTAAPTMDPAQIKENVVKQLTNPVRWTASLQQMQADGADRYIEVGPGKVLQGLVKRTLKNVTIEGYE